MSSTHRSTRRGTTSSTIGTTPSTAPRCRQRPVRYRMILGDAAHEYIAIYEFQDEQALHDWRASKHRADMYVKHKQRVAPFPEPNRSCYVQIWP